MFLGLLSLALFVLVFATRKRLDRAESSLREESLKVAKLGAALADQAAQLGSLQRQLDALSAGALPPDALSAGALPPDALSTVGLPSETPGTSVARESESVAAAAAHGDSVDENAASAGEAGLGAQPDAALSGSPPGPDPFDAAIAFARELLFGGNTVVRAGIIVLLVGVVLLLRWAAEHALFPVELRLATVALLAIGLAAFGFYKRQERPGFALTLQGGGIAGLYLVVFFAFRSYGLLPAPLAFVLLAVIAVCAGVLSVLQDSRSLIFIGQLFGFAAPLLASSGQGSHVGLFSYYLLLNVLVCAVAYFKAWRALNLLGFAFTFGVATAWGALRYEPRFFASTEPFLIAFFLLYLAIPVLYALRHPGTPGGWVDGSLVFGTPIAVLGMQWSLVHGTPFGMAFSVLALGAVYLGLAAALRRRAREQLGALAEAFLPVGVGFATLAIPYGLDDHNLTGASWALEGAGLYWVGVRQQRRLARAAAVALQLLAAGAVALDPERIVGAWPVLNSGCLAGLLLAASALFIARYAYARREQLHDREWQGLQLLIVWGLAFGLRALTGEVQASVTAEWRPGVQLCVLASCLLALELLARRLDWLPGRIPALLLWPTMAVYLRLYAWSYDVQPFARGGVFGWPMIALGMLVVQRRLVDEYPEQLRSLHALAAWLWTCFCMLLVDRVARDLLGLDASFSRGLADCVAALAALLVVLQTRGERWPFGVHKSHGLRVAALGLVALITLRIAAASFELPGSAAPLPYLPIVNALDLSALFGLVVTLTWLKDLHPSSAQRAVGYGTCAALGFLWWNALLARSVHHYAGVPFDPDALYRASALQLACSLSWTLIALSVMQIAHKRQLRTPWLVAAALLAVVVAKLFLVDLERLSTPAKIASFLGVGALLLVIGYIAPVPPARQVAQP